MARTINEINDILKGKFVEKLIHLYGQDVTDPMRQFNSTFSPASIESRLLHAIAVAIAALENMFDWLMRDVTHIVENERYGYNGWYEKMAKLFRFGNGISNDYSATSSFAESAIYADGGFSADDIAGMQVVKHAYAAENPTGVGVIVKIAGESNNNITQLTPPQLTAFTSYINRIKPAGVPVRVINEPAEILHINLKVWYDPLVLDANGVRIRAIRKPVDEAVGDYLRSIRFAGEFVVMRMIDAIQQAEGVTVVSFESATATAGSVVTNITERYSPTSGYMKLATTGALTVTYIIEN